MKAFSWAKLGKVFAPDGRRPWMQTHAQNPAVLVLADRLRVYFNCRPRRSPDGSVSAFPAFVDLDKTNPLRVLGVSENPILGLGEPGTFDQFGVMTGTVLQVEDEVWTYYAGWSRCLGVPYNHAIGLAISSDDGRSFRRYGMGPVVGRDPREPFIQNSPYVTNIDGLFHMWYSTGLRWIEYEGRMESVYVIVHATSPNGIDWKRDGRPCVEFRVDDECQTNPCVVRMGDVYHMWFCYRPGTDFRNAARGYRIGYARSSDLTTWTRHDESGALEPSAEGWDSEMVCYPCVVQVGKRLLLFYSGNGFGETGFGVAELSG